MKKRYYIILAISALLIFITIGITSYAWYINAVQSQTEDVDIPSNGLMIEYIINDDDENVNPLKFTSDDVVFFDIDNEGEGYYLPGMAVPVKLDLKNTTDTIVEVEIKELDIPTYSISELTGTSITISTSDGKSVDTFTFTLNNGKIQSITNTQANISTFIDDDGLGFVVAKTTNEKLKPVCYVDGIVTTVDPETSNYVLETDPDFAPNVSVPYITSIITSDSTLAATTDDDVNLTVEEYMAANGYTNTYTIDSLEPNGDKAGLDTVTLYIYLFGVQPNDAASNQFWKNNIYYDISFNILALTD